MKHLIYLIIGIVLTALFFVFACSDGFNIYEQMYFSQGFNDKMFNLNVYPVIAALTILVSWGGAATYYYAINSVKFDRWWHWLSVLVIVSLVTPLACHAATTALLAGAGMDYGAATVQFGLQHIMWTALLFVVASFSMRWWSTNCRHTPFPQ